MAIGTAAAIGLGIAGVGAGASALSSNSASRRAAEVSQANTDATVGLQREIYGQNRATLNPFVTRGNAAGDALNALLGLGGSQPQQQAAQPNALSQFYGTAGNAGLPYGLGDSYFAPGDFNYTDAGALGNYLSNFPQGTVPQGTVPQGGGQSALDAQNSAFENFRNSTGYQFRVAEGMDALNSGFAGSGLLQSGAALRALDDYRQNMASNEFGNYAGLLSQQQGTGLQAAGAQAGVGVNYGNTVAQLNQTNATNQANALLSRQNPLAAGLGSIGGFALGAFG